MRQTWYEPKTADDPAPMHDYESLGRDFAERSLQNVVADAKTFCGWEMERIKRTDHAEITRLRAHLALACERRDELKARLSDKPTVDLTALRHKRALYLATATVFFVAAVFMAHVSLDPFGLGWEAWPTSLALGILGMMSLLLALEEIKSPKFVPLLVVTSLVGYLALSAVLGALRADIFALHISTALSGSESDSGTVNLATDFYRHARPKLEIVFVLFAIVMEFAAGLALYRFWNLNLSPEKDFETSQKALSRVEEEMPEIASRIVSLTSRPEILEAAFKSAFQKGCVEAASRALLVSLAGIVAFSFALRAEAQVANVVIGIDFTRSVAERGYGAHTNFEENVKGARDLVTRLPPGSRVTVVAISDRSFSSPLILISGAVPTEHGPLALLDQRDAARHRLANQLAKQCAAHRPDFEASDILGFLAFGSELLRPTSGKKILILFSDMRQAGDGLDFNTPVRLTPEQISQNLERAAITDLKDTDVYVLGADAVGKNARYWNDLKTFWESYFKSSGANLREYSLTRDAPDLAGKTQ